MHRPRCAFFKCEPKAEIITPLLDYSISILAFVASLE